MRGSRQANLVTKFSLGIIPAHAGLTNLPADSCKGRWDHPRACGAHKSSCHSTGLGVGSSPRMRGSLLSAASCCSLAGIIPAHAGLTPCRLFGARLGRDHPRACGAHPYRNHGVLECQGSSPRMRGSLLPATVAVFPEGIIPAHAGLTRRRASPSAGCSKTVLRRDHPRACGAHAGVALRGGGHMGSSPRMRGSHSTIFTFPAPPGIIPAHAGLTLIKRGDLDKMRDHPRACGAHMPFTQDILSAAGSSPRMRGSLFGSLCKHILKGIIPAHAGLTLTKVARILDLRDHPRACGAHPLLTTSSTVSRGSSPRMRGSHGFCDADVRVMGIIPAHAGLTRKKKALKYGDRDHPRACGAHDDFALHCNTESGSSPRMRGSPGMPEDENEKGGIIPAHAGLTASLLGSRLPPGDHPRACGAHGKRRGGHTAGRGSSPRMRGSRSLFMVKNMQLGIIPAHAGLTLVNELIPHRYRDHPRACGAHLPGPSRERPGAGSSPRMRGSPPKSTHPPLSSRIIPAHAGLTSCRSARCGRSRDHPRACGAHRYSKDCGGKRQGSSPRMRGSQGIGGDDGRAEGIIPAHAGLTCHSVFLSKHCRDHPRACGAHLE